MTIDVTRPTGQDFLSLQELQLYHAITAYRAERGLAALPLSAALTTTAGRHVADTRENIWAEGVTLPDGANLHSWSDAYYYDDHRDPTAMWDAPRRVGTDYPSSGYEISAAGFETVEAALEGWKGSPSHDAILTGTGVWEGIELNAIGLGVDTTPGAGIYAGRIFHVWFGGTRDPSVPNIVGTDEADLVVGTAFNDRLFGLRGEDDISGGAGNDKIWGDESGDALRGGDGDDRLFGDTGEDRLWGGAGNDRLFGGAAADRIWAEDGDDRIWGDGGADFIVGGAGADQMTGGGDADTFAYNAVAESPAVEGAYDQILDFVSGEDIIRFYWLDADATTPETDPFRYIGAAGFSAAAGELRMSGGLVEGDVDGDGVADLAILVLGADTLPETDFIL